ncbi:Arc family DNA-binding protein [Asaia bogorensis]|uniref:Arc family DNA-binding protein n=1 Tax=Asaia bogorensis TaxID=91915 RepID=UPI00301AB2E1
MPDTYQYGMIAVNTKLVEFARMSEQEKQIHVRIPESLKGRIERAAKADGRSVNAEIVQRLDASFGGAQLPAPSPEQYRHTFWEIQALDDSISATLQILDRVEKEYESPGWCRTNQTKATDDFRESVHTKLRDLRYLRRCKQDYFTKLGGPYISEPGMHQTERR